MMRRPRTFPRTSESVREVELYEGSGGGTELMQRACRVSSTATRPALRKTPLLRRTATATCWSHSKTVRRPSVSGRNEA